MSKRIDEILENFLKVIAGASQIAIDRNADSGIIDFKEVIDKAKHQLYEAIKEALPKKKRLYDSPLPEYYDEYQKVGFNTCLTQIQDTLKKMFGKEE